MSVTFFFEGDEKVAEHYDCRCTWGDSEHPACKPEPGCYECKGTGTVSFTSDKHEVNLANSNARWVLDEMGLPPDEVGRIEPAKLEAASRALNESTSNDYLLRVSKRLNTLAWAAQNKGVAEITWA